MAADGGFEEISCRWMASPIGDLALYADDESLFAIEFVIGERYPKPDRQGENEVLLKTEKQLRAYFNGSLLIFDLPLQPIGTAFQLAVWQAMRSIPFGQVVTYGELAALVGGRNKARAVGQAANRNPLPIVIPCHRVVGSGGRLVGFGGGLDKKALLLRHERGEEVWRDYRNVAIARK